MTGTRVSTALPRLVDLSETVSVRPVANWREVLDRRDPEATMWGMAATAARAELGLHPVERWREILERPRLIEARLFDETLDLHWLEGRGVVLEVAGSNAAEDGHDQPPPAERIEGEAWLQRDRRSRLWGEWLEDTETWYEERIPDPLRYPGIEPGAHHRYVFLRYREYLREGRVEYVRYLGVEGGER